MRKLLAAATLSAAVLLAGCQNPDGSVNMGNTLLLGAGLATVAGVAVLASDNGHRGYRGGYGGGGYGYRPSYGYGRRGW